MKKGQLASGELFIVLIFFMIVLSLVLFFWMRNISGSIEEARTELADVHVVNLAKRVSSSPLLGCDDGGAIVRGCVDLYKARAFESVDQLNMFGIARIELVSSSGNVVMYDTLEDRNRKAIHYPTLVYDPLSRTYSFGYWRLLQWTGDA